MLLHQYARTGDIAGLTRELARRTDVEARDERTDRTPLMEAVVSPQAGTDVVRLLIAHGADVNATHSKLKRTVLSLAVGAGALGKARALLDAGANIRYRRPKQYTVLLDALHGRQIGRDPDLVPLVRLLIERGAALDTASDYGESALGVASRLGRFDVVQLLLQAGADPAPLRWTSLMEAIALGSLADAQEQIAGEHEDHYDADFCIYNDVIVHDPDGTFDIYGYPQAVFPPTDFHSATLVGDGIYIIGSLGYQGTRRFGETPVYRLTLDTSEIVRVPTTGDLPGWVNRHLVTAHHDHEIRISPGSVSVLQDGKEQVVSFPGEYVLDLRTLVWRHEVVPA